MSDITHHLPDALLADYAAGALGHSFSLVVASHVSLCPDCRARLMAHEAAGGAVLEDLVPAAAVSAGLRDQVLAALDARPQADPARQPRAGAYPGPVMTALQGREPRWRSLGLGVRQSILHDGPDGSVRLLYIPAGQAVPDHGHNGLELTLVLQGSFSDETGHFGPADVEVADGDLQHTPVAGDGPPCICLAATDAPLRFNRLIPRIFQPLFRI